MPWRKRQSGANRPAPRVGAARARPALHPARRLRPPSDTATMANWTDRAVSYFTPAPENRRRKSAVISRYCRRAAQGRSAGIVHETASIDGLNDAATGRILPKRQEHRNSRSLHHVQPIRYRL
jgi:hypothetical protein